MANELDPIEEEIAIAEEEARARLRLQGSVMGKSSPYSELDPTYGPADLLLDAGSMGATSLGSTIGGVVGKNLATRFAPSLVDSIAPQAAAKFAGALGTTSLYEKVAQYGRSEALDPLGVGVETGLNMALGPLGGRAAQSAIMGEDVAGNFMKSEPAQTAIRYQKNNFPATIPSGQENFLNDATRKAIQNAQQTADQGALRSTGQQLGVMTNETPRARGMASEWNKNAAAVIDDPIFLLAKSPEELASAATDRGVRVAEQISANMLALDESGVRIPQESLEASFAPVIELSDRLNVTPQTTGPFAKALDTSIRNLRQDMQRRTEAGNGLLKPSDLDAINKNLNLYRRTVLDSFDKNNLAQVQIGNQVLSLDDKMAEEAFSALQAGITQHLDQASMAKGLDAYSTLNSKYGGYKTVSEHALLQHDATQRTLSNTAGTRAMQSPGKNGGFSGYNFEQGLGQNLWGGVQSSFEKLTGQPSASQVAATDAQSMALNRDKNIMQSLQDFVSLRSNPAIPPDVNSTPIKNAASRALGYGIAGAVGGGIRTKLGLDTASAAENGSINQAQKLNDLLLSNSERPLLSRDFNTLKNSPDALLELKNRAEGLGILPLGVFSTLSEPIIKEVHAAVINADPEGASPVKGKLNIINGEYQNPLEKDAIVKQYLGADPQERYKYIAAAWQNKHPDSSIPREAIENIPTTPPLADLSGLLGGVSAQISPSPTQSMVDRLEQITAIHDMDVQ